MPTRPVAPEEQAERDRIGATLRTIREAKGFDPDPFASAVGISRPYLVNIEAGRKRLTKDVHDRIVAKLKPHPGAIVRADYFDAVTQ